MKFLSLLLASLVFITVAQISGSRGHFNLTIVPGRAE